MEAIVLSCHFRWVCFSMPKVLWNNNLSVSQERVVWFGWFLHVVICMLLDTDWSDKNMLFWAGIVRHRCSANQTGRCFKLKNLKNCAWHQVDFLLPLKLQKILWYFELWLQNTVGQLVCRIVYFWLVWLVNRNTRGPLLHCTCLPSKRHCDQWGNVSLVEGQDFLIDGYCVIASYLS